MDASSQLINFNLISHTHHYLNNATGSHKLVCSEWQVYIQILRTIQKFPLCYTTKGNHSICFPTQCPLDNSRRRGGRMWRKSPRKLSDFSSLRLCFLVVNNRLQMRVGLCIVGRLVWSCLRSSMSKTTSACSVSTHSNRVKDTDLRWTMSRFKQRQAVVAAK